MSRPCGYRDPELTRASKESSGDRKELTRIKSRQGCCPTFPFMKLLEGATTLIGVLGINSKGSKERLRCR